ncbi:hypothetical protein [Sagittula sp. S175]|uniref:hypothetical protein n=1 Tax=Sagittula sp. S175 TaxID=3415129 RepID=UPI003C7C2874
MLRSFMSCLFAVVVTATAQVALAQDVGVQSTAPETLVDPNGVMERLLNLDDGVVWSATCCKRCSKGKACGNSCISRSYQCHKGVGCACDG